MTPPSPAPAPVDLSPYDAVLLVSFGGPEGEADVLPFLENVTRGRGIPRERLLEVGEHYVAFGGRSPINDQCRALRAALHVALAARGCWLPVYWGNRNWHPFLADELARARADGHRRLLTLTTSAYPSYSSCRQYRENLYDASTGLDLEVDKIRQYATHPGFVAASVDAVEEALTGLGDLAARARLVFVTHSIPTAMSETSGPGDGGYVEWHLAVARAVADRVSTSRHVSYSFDLTYCSRSGPASQPWLEPDVNDHLEELAAAGTPAAVLIPIGFVSDHMEVAYDLDTEAMATASRLHLPAVRAATAGVHPAFVTALVDLLAERAAVARRVAVSPAVVDGAPIGRYECPADCCRNLREPGRPALCQSNQMTRV